MSVSVPTAAHLPPTGVRPAFASEAGSTLRSVCLYALGLGPLLALWAYVTLIEPRPYWAFVVDVEGRYVFEGLRMFGARAPLDVSAPGTPVQMLSAFAVFFTDHSPLAFDTVRNIGYGLTLLLTAGALWRFQRVVLHGLPVFAAAACCWLYFAGPQALARFHVWSPEALVPAAGLLALAALWRALEDPERTRRAFVAGIFAGVCCALDWSFVGWVPAALAAVALAAGDGRERTHGVLAFAGGVLTGFVLGTLPAVTRYGDLLAGAGAPASDASGPGGALSVLSAARGWHFALALLLVGTGIMLWRARRARGGLDPVTRGAVAFAAVALLGGYLAPWGADDLPSLLPTTLAVTALLVAYFRSAADDWVPRWLVPTFVLLLLARAAVIDVPDHHALVRDAHLDRDAVTAAVERLAPGTSPPVVLYGRRAPHPAAPLLTFAQTDRQRAAIGARYPLAGYYDAVRREVVLPGSDRRWDLVVLEQDELDSFPEPTGDVLAVLAPARQGAPALLIAGRR